MSPFLNSLFEDLKDRGRNGSFFILALAGVFGLFITMTIINQTGLDQYVMPVLPALGLLLGAWGWKTIRQSRGRSIERLRRLPLSREQLRVARSKLMKDRIAKRL